MDKIGLPAWDGNRFVPLTEVSARTGLDELSIRRLSKAGQFPVPIKISTHTSVWVESELQSYIAAPHLHIATPPKPKPAVPDVYCAMTWPAAGLRPVKMDSVIKCGVYFLMQRSRVVYVGSSININERVAAHAKTKQFSRAAWIELPVNQLFEAERNWILTLKPPLNGCVDAYGNRRYYAPGRDQIPVPGPRKSAGVQL